MGEGFWHEMESKWKCLQGEERDTKVRCHLSMGLAASGAQRCFVWRNHVSFLSTVIGKARKRIELLSDISLVRNH